MLTHDVKQGTPAWLAIRAGIPTASALDNIITPKTRKPSGQATRYLHRLLAERIMKRPVIEAVSFWMGRGSSMEAERRAHHRRLTGPPPTFRRP